MSGTFPKSDKYKTQSGPASLSTPTRRGFFLNNSSQQDVSKLERSPSTGFRSPQTLFGGTATCMSPNTQGRSVREYEEQMSALRKENFNLKLRIYFLEEKTPNSTPEEAVRKENIDLKVENESLRNELQEKQELLCQASKAIELMDDQQRELHEKYQAITNELNRKINVLNSERQRLERTLDETNKMQSSADGFAEFLNAIDVKETQTQQKVRELEVVIQSFSDQNEQLCQKIEKMEAEKLEMIRKYNDVAFENAEIRERLEENNRFGRGKELGQLQDDAYETKRKLQDTLYQLDITQKKLDEKTINNEKSLKVIQKACERIEDLELQVELLKSSQPNSLSSTESAKNDEVFSLANARILNLQKQLEEKNEEISKLKDEVKTSQSPNCKDTCCSTADFDIAHNSSFSMFVPTNEMKFNEIIEKNRNAYKKINYLKQKMINARDVEMLQMRLKEAQCEFDETEMLMRQSAVFCGILIERLDELAGFLNSLLQKKDISCNMTADLRRAISKAVDASLDISRTFNISHSPCSERERSCSHISSTEIDLVNDSLSSSPSLVNEKTIEYSFTSDLLKMRGEMELSKQSRPSIISSSSIMKPSVKQIANIKKSSSRQFNQCSDSEEWSEPDRDVSMARIGIKTENETSFVKRSTTTSEDEGANVLSDDKLCKRTDWGFLQQRISIESNVRADILQLRDAFQQTEKELQSYRFLYKKLVKERHENEDKLNVLSHNLKEKCEEIELLKEDKDSLNIELKSIQTKYEQQIKDIENLQKRCVECESALQQKTRDFEKQEIDFKNELQQNWIQKYLYNQLFDEFEKKQEKIVDSNKKIEILEDELKQLRDTLKTKENMIAAVNRNLESTSLQLSVASVERARTINDKRNLEAQLKQLTDAYQELSNEKQDLNLKIAELEETNAKLQNKLVVGDKPFFLHQPLSSDASGYASEETGGVPGTTPRCTSSSSIDEKIKDKESRERLLLPLLKTRSEHRIVSDCDACKKLTVENSDLKKNLSQSKRSLEQAYAKLRAQNMRKAQIEQDIKQQILKTQNVLQNVRTNMENEMSKKTLVTKDE